MKNKLFTLFCLIFVLILQAATGFATSNTVSYSIDEAGITISLPANYTVFTRNTSADNQSLADIGLTYDSLMAKFEAENIFLEAFDENLTNEIIVTFEETDDKDFSKCTDEEIGLAADTEEKLLMDEDKTVLFSDVYEADGNKFILTKTRCSDSYNEIQYLSVAGERKIRIRLTSFDEDIDSELDSQFRQTIDAVEFAEIPVHKISDEENDDKASGSDGEASEDKSENEEISPDNADKEKTDPANTKSGKKGISSTGIPHYIIYIIIAVAIILIVAVMFPRKK